MAHHKIRQDVFHPQTKDVPMFYSASASDINNIINTIDGIQLSDSSALIGSAEQSGDNLPVLIIDTSLCRAAITLQGAQLLHFERKSDGQPLVWCSPQAIYQKGKAVRGGIPVCFPWFGAHQSDSSKPNHGFVRDNDWKLLSASQNNRGELQLSFEFSSCDETIKLFPHSFNARLNFTLGDSVEATFSVKNTSDSDMPCSWALHSYLPVTNLDSTEILGLDGCHFLNTVGTPSNEIQNGAVTFPGEVDRVYADVGHSQNIVSSTANSNIVVSGENCPTAIVWNPGRELASTMTDLGSDASREFVCVERGAAFSNAWNIASGEEKTATISIK